MPSDKERTSVMEPSGNAHVDSRALLNALVAVKRGDFSIRLPQFSWNEIFTVVDQLSREGRLALCHPSRIDYEVSIGPIQSARKQSEEGSDAEGNRPASQVNPNCRPQVYEETILA